MRDDRVYFDFVRAFAPDRVAKFISLKALGVLALALIALVIAIELGKAIA